MIVKQANKRPGYSKQGGGGGVSASSSKVSDRAAERDSVITASVTSLELGVEGSSNIGVSNPDLLGGSSEISSLSVGGAAAAAVPSRVSINDALGDIDESQGDKENGSGAAVNSAVSNSNRKVWSVKRKPEAPNFVLTGVQVAKR